MLQLANAGNRRYVYAHVSDCYILLISESFHRRELVVWYYARVLLMPYKFNAPWCILDCMQAINEFMDERLHAHYTRKVNVQPCPLHEPQKIINLNISNQVTNHMQWLRLHVLWLMCDHRSCTYRATRGAWEWRDLTTCCRWLWWYEHGLGRDWCLKRALRHAWLRRYW